MPRPKAKLVPNGPNSGFEHIFLGFGGLIKVAPTDFLEFSASTSYDDDLGSL